MFSRVGLVAVVLAASFGFGAAQAVTTIDFDGLANETFVDSQFASDGILFSSAGGGVRVFATSESDTSPNTIIGTSANGVADSTQLVEFSFFVGGSEAITDFVSVAFADLFVTGSSMTAFDILGNQLGQAFVPCAVNFNCGNSIEIVSLSVAGIHRVVLDGQSNAVFDTVTFNDVERVVPLPAALPLALSGFALLGVMGWRRRVT